MAIELCCYYQSNSNYAAKCILYVGCVHYILYFRTVKNLVRAFVVIEKLFKLYELLSFEKKFRREVQINTLGVSMLIQLAVLKHSKC